MSFSSKNDAESLGHFVKIPFLDPKRAKLTKSLTYVMSEPLQGSPPGKSSKKTYPFLNAFLRKNVVFGLQTAFFDGFNVLMSFLAEK